MELNIFGLSLRVIQPVRAVYRASIYHPQRDLGLFLPIKTSSVSPTGHCSQILISNPIIFDHCRQECFHDLYLVT